MKPEKPVYEPTEKGRLVGAEMLAEKLKLRDIKPSEPWIYYGVFPRDKVEIMQQVGSEFGVSVEILVEEGRYTIREASTLRPVTGTLREGEVYARLSRPEFKGDLTPFWRKVDELKKAAKPK